MVLYKVENLDFESVPFATLKREQLIVCVSMRQVDANLVCRHAISVVGILVLCQFAIPPQI